MEIAKFLKKDSIPWVLIGIAGGSGSGKTTFAEQLRQRLGNEVCGILQQDAYYRGQSENLRGDWSVNFDHPKSVEFGLMAVHLTRLKKGSEVDVPNYCFESHRRLDSVTRLFPSPVILIEGTLVLSDIRVRSHLDIGIFIDTPQDVRLERRLQRDIRERGRTIEGCKSQFFSTVKPMHDRFVEPSKEYAQVVYPGTESFVPLIKECTKRLRLRVPVPISKSQP